MTHQELEQRDPHFQIGWWEQDAKSKQDEIERLREIIAEQDNQIADLRLENYRLEQEVSE